MSDTAPVRPLPEPEKAEDAPSHVETTVAGPDPHSDIRGDRFEIEFLLMSGKRKRWTVGSEETVDRVRDRIFADWPQEWKVTESPVTSPNSIRLLYLGRFLEPSSLLSSYKLRPPEEEGSPPSIVHLHIRTLPSPQEEAGGLKDSNRPASACRCCVIC
ncbi:hypothetical protein JCM3766R1_002926 [Sporobolomyces carnicolor]